MYILTKFKFIKIKSSFDDNIQMNTIARVRGLPWHVNDHDVQRFFSGLNICE